MMWWVFWPALVLSVTSAFGGASHKQIRTGCNYAVARGLVCESDRIRLEDLRGKSAKQATQLLKGASIEHLYWDADGKIPATDFRVGIVEFDDQGNEWDAGQISSVQESLRATFDDGRGALVVVFVHGWKNNCEACNGNLACFRETLALLAGVEKKLADTLNENGIPARPRQVFGLYVAWRGASATVEPAKEASFFSRKSVADRIGSSRGGTLTNLLSWVNAKKRSKGTPSQPLGDMVAIVGHSFGADVLYGTIANGLDEAIGASDVTGDPTTPFGDLAVLVNPAFEASAYLRFAEYAKQDWPKGQLPLLVTVQARNDWATHYTFPLGRTISTLPQVSSSRNGYRAMIDALGHYSDFYTHSLDRPQSPQAAAMATMSKKQPADKCGCDGTRATTNTLDLLWRNFEKLLQSLAELQANPAAMDDLHIGSPMLGVASSMTPCGSANIDSPLLVVRADPAIVDGHSGITHVEFFDFLANFLARVQALRAKQEVNKGRPAAAAAPVAAASFPACH
jgi:hypothetical protein